MADKRIALTVLTGFLGSGKTTLLNRLVREPAYADAAVIVNEYGEVGVDHHLVRTGDDRLVLLEGGCICCVASGSLVDTLRELFMQALQRRIRPFRRVLVETTGLASPAPIMFTLRHDAFLSERYRYAGAIAVADVRRVGQQLARQPEAAQQIALADVVAFSKMDLAGDGARAQAERDVLAVNPSVPRCVLAADQPLDPLLSQVDLLPRRAGADNWLGHYARSARHPGLCVVSLALSRPMGRPGFLAAMDVVQARYEQDLLRVKGLVCFAGETLPCAVHGVHRELYPPEPLPQWPDSRHESRLLFILRGADLAQAESFIRQALGQDAKEP